MTRYSKTAHGHYVIKGSKYEQLVGSRAQVGHGTAYKTSGGLTKKDLMQNKHGRFVSKKKYFTAKKERRLAKAGYVPKKGVFGVSKSTRKQRKGSRKMMGGSVRPHSGSSHSHLRGASLKGGKGKKYDKEEFGDEDVEDM